MSLATATHTEAQQVLEKIAAAIEDSRQFARQDIASHDQILRGGYASKFFSDNLAFAFALQGADAEQAAGAWFIIRCATGVPSCEH